MYRKRITSIIDSRAGFTLIEMLVSVGIFAVVMVISIGALLIVNDAYRKTRQLRDVMDNVNLTMELVSKEIRAGRVYHCDTGVTPRNAPRDCPRTSSGGGSTSFVFKNSNGTEVRYRHAGGQLQRFFPGCCWAPILNPDVTVDSLKFYVDGAEDDSSSGSKDPLAQPRLTMTITGAVDIPQVQTDFHLQVTASQRVVEFN